MNTLLYEDHGIYMKELPFIFHTDNICSGISDPNWHANPEFLCCIEGEGSVTCDTREYPFSAGDVIIVNPDIVHILSSNTKIVYHCLIVDFDFLAANDLPIHNLHFQELIQDPQIFCAYNDMIDIIKRDTLYHHARVRHAILGYLLLLLETYAVSDTTNESSTSHAQRIKDTIKYLQKNISSSLTLEEIAAHVGVSKCYLSREFKKYTSHTIFEYINLIRCKEAMRLIRQGMSVSAAARSCGFENMSYFSRTYKKYMGTLPSQLPVQIT